MLATRVALHCPFHRLSRDLALQALWGGWQCSIGAHGMTQCRHSAVASDLGARMWRRNPGRLCNAVAGVACLSAAEWLARRQMHRRSLSGTHRPLDGPPNTFAHDASSRGPVVHADMRRENGVVDFAGRLRLISGANPLIYTDVWMHHAVDPATRTRS